MSSDLLKLCCRNFRSYAALSLNFSSKFVVFHGDNGAGKTNILEAISLFSSSRGMRKSTIADLGTAKSTLFSWNLELILKNMQYRTFLSTSAQNGRRYAKIDNVQVNSLSKFEEIVWILWVVPSMGNIFISDMSCRRKFFDHLVAGYDRKHKQRLKNLSNLQKERLHVIFYRKNESWLEILERKIAEENVNITKSRLEFIDILHNTFDRYPSEFLRPQISILGNIERIYETNSEENAVLEIAYALKNERFSDSEKQITSISSQKTSLQVKHSKTFLESEKCSTGEQKAFLISIILAVARIHRKSFTGIPILLLDDLMMHLDRFRRKNLVDELISINIQTFFTGTDAYLFEDLKEAQVYRVEKSICTVVS